MADAYDPNNPYAFKQTLATPGGGFGYTSPYDPILKRLYAERDRPVPPKYTPEELAGRREENERQYDLGLLGLLSGNEGLQQAGGLVFKQALAGREPKVTERGAYDPMSEQWSYNPDWQREKVQTQIDKVEGFDANMRAQYNENRIKYGERIAAEIANDQRDAALRRELAQGGIDLRTDLAQERTDRAKAGDENKLRNEFDTMTKGLREEMDATSKIGDVINSYVGHPVPPFAQQSLVILLNKFLDPGSVVREGEFDRVVQGQGLMGKAQLLLPRIMSGEILTPDAVVQINQLAGVYQQAALSKMKKHAGLYEDLAVKRGLDPTSVVLNPGHRSGRAPTGNRVVTD